jgi:hypothetical protein
MALSFYLGDDFLADLPQQTAEMILADAFRHAPKHVALPVDFNDFARPGLNKNGTHFLVSRLLPQ